ncbi:MAG: T9SS type A sorting domain-containing protein [Candidatus Marinimicrobia bacterium]|nr:T9SS type A sorting domain-containing protein [Candidatus Neomarinimicrobiota bacterium]
MKKVVTIFSVLVLTLFSFSFAGITGFTRSGVIDIPEATLNNGGIGGIISGVDLDKDGKTEIYLVNDNWNDGASEVIPRIYKLEKNGANWDIVWQAKLDPAYQNTWPALLLTDLDNDQKEEITWMPVNAFSVSTNPVRIAVYEQGTGDILGVDDGAGGYKPNSTWTITTEQSINIRPIDAEAVDIDGDGTTEVIFADRAGNNGGYYVGVCSVSNIPDNADGSETWTLEASGKDWSMTSTVQNKWDVAVTGNNAYFFSETEISKLSFNSGWSYTALSPLAGGAPVQSAKGVDLDKDGTKEIVCAVYDWGDDTKKGVYLLQEVADTLKATELFNLSAYWPTGARGPWGGASGDIDGDGYLDFIFGSRDATPNGLITCVSYKGGDITNPANYELMLIDSLYSATEATGVWSVLNIANIDDDPEAEVLYTSSTSYAPDVFTAEGSAPIVILDATVTSSGADSLIVAPEVLFNGAAPSGILFKPGRALNNGNVIWFCGVDGTNKVTYVFRSTDGGKTFTHNTTAIPGRAAQVDAFDANIAVVATAVGEIYRTTNGGQDWTLVHTYLADPVFSGAGWFDGIRVLNDSVAVALGDGAANGDLYFARSIDKGATWTEITGVDYMSASQAIYSWGTAVWNNGESVWFTGTTSSSDTAYVYRSYDAGVNWESFEVPTGCAKVIRGITFTSDSDGMAVGINGGDDSSIDGVPFVTTDGGETWDLVSSPVSADGWVNAVVAVPGTSRIMAFCDYGEVFYTDNLGDSWTPVPVASALSGNDFLGAVVADNDFGYFFTYQGNVARYTNQSAGSAIDPGSNHITSLDNFRLQQNYPNPFNATTNIVFDVPSEKVVTLTIYDLLGKEVVTLVNKKLSTGTYTITWNGLDRNGSAMSTGVYLYAVKNGNVTKVKRMTMVK